MVVLRKCGVFITFWNRNQNAITYSTADGIYQWWRIQESRSAIKCSIAGRTWMKWSDRRLDPSHSAVVSDALKAECTLEIEMDAAQMSRGQRAVAVSRWWDNPDDGERIIVSQSTYTMSLPILPTGHLFGWSVWFRRKDCELAWNFSVVLSRSGYGESWSGSQSLQPTSRQQLAIFEFYPGKMKACSVLLYGDQLN